MKLVLLDFDICSECLEGVILGVVGFSRIATTKRYLKAGLRSSTKGGRG